MGGTWGGGDKDDRITQNNNIPNPQRKEEQPETAIGPSQTQPSATRATTRTSTERQITTMTHFQSEDQVYISPTLR
jgi:hypothetical protein